MRAALVLMVVSFAACAPPTVRCGAGTLLAHGECVAATVDASTPAPDAGATVDAGAADVDAGGVDPGDAAVDFIDWSTSRGAALDARHVGTFDLGSGQLLAVLPHALVLAEGDDCRGADGPCSIRWVDDAGQTLAHFTTATRPLFLDDGRALFIADGALLACTSPFASFKLVGNAVEVDERGQVLHTFSSTAVRLEFSYERRLVRVTRRGADLSCDFGLTGVWTALDAPYAPAPAATLDALTQLVLRLDDGRWVIHQLDGGVDEGALAVYDPDSLGSTPAGTAPPPVIGPPITRGALPPGDFALATLDGPITLFNADAVGPLHTWQPPEGAAPTVLWGLTWTTVLVPPTGNRRTLRFHDARGTWPDRTVDTATVDSLLLRTGPATFAVKDNANAVASVLNVESDARTLLQLSPPFSDDLELTTGALLSAGDAHLHWLVGDEVFELGPSPRDARVQADVALLHDTALDGEVFALFDAHRRRHLTLTRQGHSRSSDSAAFNAGWNQPDWLEARSGPDRVGFTEQRADGTLHYLVVPTDGSWAPREVVSFAPLAEAAGRSMRSLDGTRLAVGYGPPHAVDVWLTTLP